MVVNVCLLGTIESATALKNGKNKQQRKNKISNSYQAIQLIDQSFSQSFFIKSTYQFVYRYQFAVIHIWVHFIPMMQQHQLINLVIGICITHVHSHDNLIGNYEIHSISH